MFAAVGLITASGAFTTVEAERTADVEVAGDANALLALNAGDSYLIENTDDEVRITLDSSDANGINLNATTSAAPANFLTVTNNGQQDISFNVSAPTESGVDVYFVVNSTYSGDLTATTSNELTIDGTSISDTVVGEDQYSISENGGLSITSGESADIGLVIVTDGTLSDGNQIFSDGTVTFTAESSEN